MATIKELLGDQYKDGMTFEEIEKALEGKKLVDLTTGDYVAKGKLIDAEQKQKIAEQKYNERLTEEEKQQKSLAERDEHYKSIERENALYKYKEELSASITDKDVLANVATLFADGKFQDGIKAQNAYFAKEKSNIAKQLQAELLKQQPTPAPQTDNSSNGGITKKDFDKMSYAEREELYNKDRTLYDELTK